MTFRRYANTDYQEYQLNKIEKLAKALKFNLSYGTSVGKSPHTIILDHNFQDNFMSISSDSKWGIRIHGEKVTFLELKEIMKKEKIK